MSGLNIRKKLIIVLACAVTALSCVAPKVFADSAPDSDKATLVVGIPTERCPVFYFNEEENEYQGIGIDLLYLAAENAGYKVEIREISKNRKEIILLALKEYIK